MIDDELMKKFDSIEDLPISEEMLGAYLENNLDSIEMSNLEFTLKEDSELSNFVNDISYDNLSMLDNIEAQLFGSSCPIFRSDFDLPYFESDVMLENLFETQIATSCCMDDFSGLTSPFCTDDMISLDSMQENSLFRDDSFIGDDHSLDSHSISKNDDMFNNDSIDI